MNKKALLVFIFFLLFSAGASWFYLCKVKQVCSPTETTTHSLSSSIDESIVFEWENEEVFKGNSFSEMKSQLLKELQGGQQIEIIGLYDPQESNFTSYENLGKARAQAIVELFPEIQMSQIRLSSEMRTLEQEDDYYKASRINIIFGHDRIPTTNDTVEQQDS